jgi:predicted alpha/beta hydrolase
MSIKGQQMKINNLNLNIVVEGEGEPVMLLHGFPDSNYVWRDVIPLLVKAGYKVIAPDQRGFGESDAPEGKENYEMELIAKDAVAILDKLGIKKAKLVKTILQYRLGTPRRMLVPVLSKKRKAGMSYSFNLAALPKRHLWPMIGQFSEKRLITTLKLTTG